MFGRKQPSGGGPRNVCKSPEYLSAPSLTTVSESGTSRDTASDVSHSHPWPSPSRAADSLRRSGGAMIIHTNLQIHARHEPRRSHNAFVSE
ncbi:hypothetical protein XA68_16350 [Ophiocordyceps unilateralis]|uniref:Uncharacterized protein n=1 Tax=Ophiocordyceps unilateralis TaxID=268505 RepID=A0A2A9P6P9_OPHUN|nr:hypothetical protein XA68_16350 [Ophiocordyceps unilateralis]